MICHSIAHRNFIEMSNADIKVYAFLPFPPQLCCDIVDDMVYAGEMCNLQFRMSVHVYVCI